jgi:hypothetical protein
LALLKRYFDLEASFLNSSMTTEPAFQLDVINFALFPTGKYYLKISFGKK